MQSKTLKLIMKLRKIRQSQIATFAGVSRQAVSLWMKQPTINLQSKNLSNLANNLGIQVGDLLHPLPVLNNKDDTKTLYASLLWDHLYPTFEDFVIALVNYENSAIARLVQVYGLYASEKILGPIIWRQFLAYKRFLHPVRQTQCESLWKLHKNPPMI